MMKLSILALFFSLAAVAVDGKRIANMTTGGLFNLTADGFPSQGGLNFTSGVRPPPFLMNLIGGYMNGSVSLSEAFNNLSAHQNGTFPNLPPQAIQQIAGYLNGSVTLPGALNNLTNGGSFVRPPFGNNGTFQIQPYPLPGFGSNGTFPHPPFINGTFPRPPFGNNGTFPHPPFGNNGTFQIQPYPLPGFGSNGTFPRPPFGNNETLSRPSVGRVGQGEKCGRRVARCEQGLKCQRTQRGEPKTCQVQNNGNGNSNGQGRTVGEGERCNRRRKCESGLKCERKRCVPNIVYDYAPPTPAIPWI